MVWTVQNVVVFCSQAWYLVCTEIVVRTILSKIGLSEPPIDTIYKSIDINGIFSQCGWL